MFGIGKLVNSVDSNIKLKLQTSSHPLISSGPDDESGVYRETIESTAIISSRYIFPYTIVSGKTPRAQRFKIVNNWKHSYYLKTA